MSQPFNAQIEALYRSLKRETDRADYHKRERDAIAKDRDRIAAERDRLAYEVSALRKTIAQRNAALEQASDQINEIASNRDKAIALHCQRIDDLENRLSMALDDLRCWWRYCDRLAAQRNVARNRAARLQNMIEDYQIGNVDENDLNNPERKG